MEQSKKGKMFDIKTIILSTVIAVVASSISVYASNYLFASSEVSYDNTNSGLASTNVQEALDELYGDATDYTSIEQRVSVLEASQLSLDDIYPVGSIYITATESDVSAVETKFGGSWEAYGQGRTLVGMGSNGTNNYTTVGATGGSTTQTLAVGNLPDHTHKYTPAGTNSYTTKDVTTGNQSAQPTVDGGGITKGITGGAHTHNMQMNSTTYLALQAASGWRLPYGTTDAGSRYTVKSSTHTHDLPNHTHTVSGNHTHTITADNLKTAIGTITFTGKEKSTTECTNCSGTAFSTQDPYITVYMYKRIS